MCGILNAVSMGVAGRTPIVAGTIGVSFDFLVDFANMHHLKSILLAHGDATEITRLGGWRVLGRRLGGMPYERDDIRGGWRDFFGQCCIRNLCTL